jgi:hypothetical protein
MVFPKQTPTRVCQLKFTIAHVMIILQLVDVRASAHTLGLGKRIKRRALGLLASAVL